MVQQPQFSIPPTEEIISAYQASYDDKRQVLQVVLISSTRKIRKRILEYLVTYRNRNGESKEETVIGKMYSDQAKGFASYRLMQYLWKNGFDTDSPYTIVRPVAYIQHWRMLLMTKAPGKTLDEQIHDPGTNTHHTALLVANWLARLHAIPVPEMKGSTRTRANADVRRFYEELAELMPSEAARLKHICDQLLKKSERAWTDQAALLHGDFHPKNIFINEQQVIAIDFDHHFAGDPAWDVAYLGCQMQLNGFFQKGDFDYFRPVIRHFIETYLDAHPSCNRESFYDRLSLYSARSLYESLHYELCVLKTGKLTILEPLLARCQLHLQGKGFH